MDGLSNDHKKESREYVQHYGDRENIVFLIYIYYSNTNEEIINAGIGCITTNFENTIISCLVQFNI